MNKNPRRTFLKMAAALPAALAFPVRLFAYDDRGPKLDPESTGLPVRTDNKQAVSVEDEADYELNKDYTFSTFVVGRNNEWAHAATLSVSEGPAERDYYPLYICGPCGMGKTHLLHAFGHNFKLNFPSARIRYVSAERFLNECITAIRRNEMNRFRRRFRDGCDVLLMDDVQILGRGEAVQEEFFNTLNHFSEARKQVVVTSDSYPKAIRGLENRICTRLEWGLIADMEGPDLNTRVAVLRKKAQRRKIDLDESTIHFLARSSRRSVRELEGNLTKVKMFSELKQRPITLQLAKEVLRAKFS